MMQLESGFEKKGVPYRANARTDGMVGLWLYGDGNIEGKTLQRNAIHSRIDRCACLTLPAQGAVHGSR